MTRSSHQRIRLLAVRTLIVFAVVLGAAPLSTGAQVSEAPWVRSGNFDFGKMWTFEYAPAEYFSDTYGFDATPEWFERARLAALRIPGCSASFVSSEGLVVTNHHCARGAISSVTREGESLLDDGFYAPTLADERQIPRYYADQLVAAVDVTADIYAAVDRVDADERAAAREGAIAEVRARLQAEYQGGDPVLVQVVPLYNGGRYSAYVIRRFRDVRLVAAAELNMGFFGGDPDNFTYPRYALDFAFYRIYDSDGEPYEPTHWFTWGDGVEEGDPVFIIGNPGPTNRLQTVAQLQYQRDVQVPTRKAFFESRLSALRDAYADDPVEGERLDLRNRAFSLSNSLKAYTGRLSALGDPSIMVRKERAEEDLEAALEADPDLAGDFAGTVEGLAVLQKERRELAGEEGAFYRLGNAAYGSRALIRAAVALQLSRATEGGAAAAELAELRSTLGSVDDHPASLEEDLLALRLADLQTYLGDDDPLVMVALEGRSPEGAAASLLRRSVLATRSGTVAALEASLLPDTDPLIALAGALEVPVSQYQGRITSLTAKERELAADLGRARFAVYGTAVPPDATSSPRITDGVVKGYSYNGTKAPPYTTLFGLYDRYYSHDGHVDWQLPARWLPAPEGLDLSTPLNFVSTADTYGGNSGSPAVTRDLAIVGLNFDRNIEGLSRDFIYLPEQGRNIMVDVRAIRESLEKVYQAHRLVDEILAGRNRASGSH
jgi:hypothetical protein